MWDATTPSITTMLRGLVGEEIEITCADKDLHSGMYGNAARNPNQVLAEIIASLRNPDGSIAVAGFYDDVEEVPADVAAQLEGARLRRSGLPRRSPGLKIPAGEKNRSVLEQTWSRPTCEINGMMRRLYRRRLQDRDPGQGERQDLVPAGLARWTPRRSATPSARMSAPAFRPIAR